MFNSFPTLRQSRYGCRRAASPFQNYITHTYADQKNTNTHLVYSNTDKSLTYHLMATKGNHRRHMRTTIAHCRKQQNTVPFRFQFLSITNLLAYLAFFYCYV